MTPDSKLTECVERVLESTRGLPRWFQVLLCIFLIPHLVFSQLVSAFSKETPGFAIAIFDYYLSTIRNFLKTDRNSASSVPCSPPKKAEFLLRLLLTRDIRDSLPGDLEEEFRTEMVPRFGAAWARRWYWFQVIRSILPIVFRLFIKLKLIGWLVDKVKF